MKAFLSTTVIPAHLIPDAIRLSIAHVPLKTFNGCKMTGALLCIKNGNMPAREGEKKKRKRQHVAVIGVEFIIFGVWKVRAH